MKEYLFDPPPENVAKINEEVRQLCNSGYDIRIEDVAPLVGLNHETLRKMIAKGSCPFALGYDRTYFPNGKIKENGVYRVPILPFYNFMTQHWIYHYRTLEALNRQIG